MRSVPYRSALSWPVRSGVPISQPWMSLATSSRARPLSAWLLVTETSVKPLGPEAPVASVTETLAATFTSLWLLAAGLSLVGVTPQLVEGAVVSILTVSVSGPLELSNMSLTEQFMLWVPSPETGAVQVPSVEPAVSVREVVPSVQVGAPARPLPESLAETLSVTGEVLFQPLVLSGVWLTERVGAVVSGGVA